MWGKSWLGFVADVYLDKEDPNKVIKIFKDSINMDDLKHEINCFKKCHGEESAEIIKKDNHIIGFKMKKIRGNSLDKISHLPFGSEKSLEREIIKLEKKASITVT